MLSHGDFGAYGRGMNSTAGPKARLAQVLGASMVPGSAADGAAAQSAQQTDPAEVTQRLVAAPRWGRRPMWFVVIALAGLLVIGGMVVRWWSAPQRLAAADSQVVLTPASESAAARPDGAEAAAETPLSVHVAGGVAQPGLVSVPAGARVADAVAAAGGALPGVTLDSVNLARKVVDGEQVLVGGNPESTASSAAASNGAAATDVGGAASTDATVVNINTATAEELQQLPRVGPATAAKIIDYRTANGPFTSVDQLLDVPGIGERTLANFRDQIRV